MSPQVTGQPNLALDGPGGRLSGEATAGKAETFAFDIGNSGSAPAKAIHFTASAPSGWKVAFRPDQLPGLDTDGHQPVQVEITPSEKAIAGDYMVTIRANGEGASDSAEFRVTVTTSTVWGIAGLGIISAVGAGAGACRDPLRPAMSAPVIEARGLTKRYGRVTAVDNLDLTIEAGEVFGLLGPNGSGKTTTILMILGLTDPTEGAVSVLGRDPLREPLAVKKRVGYLPDAVGFYDQLTARENLAYVGAAAGTALGRGRRSASQRR